MSVRPGKNILLYCDLHRENADFGAASDMVEEVSLLIRELEPKTVLDYGCGKGALIDRLAERFPDIAFHGYDPAIPGRDVLPVDRADLVINMDVLEHIPENELPPVIEEISRISQTVFFGLHHGPARAVLPNGENAHCTIKPREWYHELLQKYFSALTPLPGKHFFVSVVLTSDVSPEFREKYAEMTRLWKERQPPEEKWTIFRQLQYWKSILFSKILWGKRREKHRLKAMSRNPERFRAHRNE